MSTDLNECMYKFLIIMVISQTTILYLISFLDSLCFGLIMPVLATYLLILGANHKVLGLLGMLHMLLQLFAVPLGHNYSEKYGKKLLLLITLCISMFTNMSMGIVTKYLSVIMIRLIFYLTNQTQTICKAFIADLEIKEKHTHIYSTMSLLGVLGFVVGPIIGGYLFDMKNGYYYISLTTFFLMQCSVLLALLLPSDQLKPTNKQNENLAEKLYDSLESSLGSLKSLQLQDHWNIIILKILTTVSLTAFFIKFSLLLKIHYGANSTVIGFTVAYQSISIFLGSFLVPFGDRIYSGQHMKMLLHSLSLLTISMANVCYAPTLIMYLICFIPLSIAKCVLDSVWRNVINSMKTANRSLENISNALDTVTTLTSIITPLVFGYFCDLYTHNAVKGFSIIPLGIALLLLHFFGRKYFTKFKLN